ncbi:MAG: response regulator transcription factor [Acidobacteria bacterium]|nr:response regulator transcription factor [Acidobacteriota bacterium]
MEARKPTAILADDHAVVLAGLRRILDPVVNIICEVSDGRTLLAQARSLEPDVIVADLSMPNLNGIEVARRVKELGLRSRVLILSMHNHATIATEAIRAGAHGYVTKDAAQEVLVGAVRDVLDGRLYLPPFLTEGNPLDFQVRQLNSKSGAELSNREREVLQMVAEGKSLKEIAADLNIALRTVVFHKRNISQKLGVKSTAALTRYAVEQRLV